MSVEVNANLAPIYQVAGAVQGITGATNTSAYKYALTNLVADELRQLFKVDFTAVSLANPKTYHHVWEWNAIGTVPLWYTRRIGRGDEKRVTFGFRQSLREVPLPTSEETGIPQENIDRLKNRAIFRFKALVMESGQTVHIKPVRAKALFVPTPGAKNKAGETTNFMFRKSVTMRDAGGPGTTGSFATFWTLWWASQAEGYLQSKIMPEIERGIDSVAERQMASIRYGKYARMKTFTFQPQSALLAIQQQQQRNAEMAITRWVERMADEEEYDEDEE